MNYLTREEALEALNNGCHVSHTSFMSDEYIYKNKYGVLLDEVDCRLDYYNFFDDRQGKSIVFLSIWDTGWFIVNKSH
jgi:hypothetical protein